MSTVPVIETFKENNITIRRRAVQYAKEYEQYILDRVDYGVMPSQLMQLLENVMVFTKTNKRALKYEVLAEEQAADGTKIEVYSYLTKKQLAFINARIYFDAKYMYHKENLCIITSHGNDIYRNQYIQSKDLKGLSLALTVFSAFKFEPVFDKADPSKVIGTKTILISVSDFGGSIPQYLIKKFTPKELKEFLDDMVIGAKKEFPLTS